MRPPPSFSAFCLVADEIACIVQLLPPAAAYVQTMGPLSPRVPRLHVHPLCTLPRRALDSGSAPPPPTLARCVA